MNMMRFLHVHDYAKMQPSSGYQTAFFDLMMVMSPHSTHSTLEAGLRVYALDLLGNGYTDKLDPTSEDG